MNKFMIGMCCGCLLAGTSALSAAQSTDKKSAIMGKEMKVTGCIVQGSDADHFMLNNAMTSEQMKEHKDTTADMKSMSYGLMGGELKAHVNHKVEITGTMGHAKMMGTTGKTGAAGEPTATTGSGMADMHTLNVTSVKMISTTCN